jgi:putative transposase
MENFIFFLKNSPCKNREFRQNQPRQEGFFAMKKSKFAKVLIVFGQRQAETGTQVADVCRKMTFPDATCYNLKKKYGGLGLSEQWQLMPLEEENRR